MKLLGIGLCGDCGCTDATKASPDVKTNNLNFTYDEGQGVKDTIVMDGPLSQIYAKALNIYLAKKPLQVEDTNSLSQAFESAAIDSVISQAIIDNEDESNPLNNVKILDSFNDLVESPKAVIYTTSASYDKINSEMQVIEVNAERMKRSGKDFVVFVAPEFGIKGDVEPRMLEIDFNNISKITAFNISDKFKRATESLFEQREIPVVIGFEDLVQWVKDHSKG